MDSRSWLLHSSKHQNSKGLVEKASECAAKNPSVVFASGGEGMGMDGAMISFHRSFSDFSDFIADLKTGLFENLRDIQSFLMTTDGERVIKSFSLKYLEEVGVEGT